MKAAFIIAALLLPENGGAQQKRKTHPQAPTTVREKELYDMATTLPMNIDAYKYVVRGAYGGHTYYESEVPTYRVESGSLIQDGGVAVGTELTLIKFSASNQSYLYQFVTAGTDVKTVDSKDLRWVKGLFLSAAPKGREKAEP